MLSVREVSGIPSSEISSRGDIFPSPFALKNPKVAGHGEGQKSVVLIRRENIGDKLTAEIKDELVTYREPLLQGVSTT
jgi:hypothetical protein